MDLIERITAYEQGELTDNAVLELFSDLIASRTIFHLQGAYQRMADSLICEGYLSTRGTVLVDFPDDY